MESYIIYTFCLTSLVKPMLFVFMRACEVASVMSNSVQPYALYPARLLCLWAFSGKNTGVGCHALLQGIFLTQDSNLHPKSSALAGGFSPLAPSIPFVVVVHCSVLLSRISLNE